MHHAVVGVGVALVGVELTDEVAAVLRAVVGIRVTGTRSVGVQRVVVVRVVVVYSLDSHAGVLLIDDFEAAVLVSGIEYQRLLMLVNHTCARGAQRLPQRCLAVESPVLSGYDEQVVERILHLSALGVDYDGELLVGVVVVYVGLRSHADVDRCRGLAHHEAALQDGRLGVVLAVYLQQIVARDGRAHLLVGDGQRIVDIGHEGGTGEVVHIDCPFVESVKELAVHQSVGLPSGRAVLERVAEVLAVVGKVVERYADAVVGIEHSHGCAEGVAVEVHLQRADALVEDARHRVDRLLRIRGHGGGQYRGQ